MTGIRDETRADEARDPAAVARFVERFAQVLVEAGVPRIAARVFVALVATDSGRLTAAELADRLQASPAAISGGVRYLIQLRLASREREPGSRRDHYRVSDDVWHQTILQRDQLVARWTSSLREGIEAVGEETAAGERMADTVEFFEFLQKELRETMGRWHEYRARRPSPIQRPG
jgi:DNA-binding transcriptional regulator GbsR (MarR family)